MAHPKIEKLYRMIPSFKCMEGCSDCCSSLVPFAKSEWDSIPEKKDAKSIKCPYVTEDNGCSIHQVKPFMCRIFGAGKDPLLKCPRGCGPEKPLSWEKARKLTNRYHELIGK
jgi:hypothetical protein